MCFNISVTDTLMHKIIAVFIVQSQQYCEFRYQMYHERITAILTAKWTRCTINERIAW